jgi:hypothetical protein
MPLAVLSLIHAAAMLVVWLLEIYADVSVMPARPWLMLAWGWFLWPLIFLLFPQRISPVRRLVVAIVGLAVLSPCLSTMISFTDWSLFGFAP